MAKQDYYVRAWSLKHDMPIKILEARVSRRHEWLFDCELQYDDRTERVTLPEKFVTDFKEAPSCDTLAFDKYQ